ncbi:MAG: FecR family protein [Lacipirellulaceae bacterium]
MSAGSPDHRRIRRMIADLHDGLLSDEQVAELESVLRQDASLRSEYFDFVMLHALLEVKHEPALRAATAAEVDVEMSYLANATSTSATAGGHAECELASPLASVKTAESVSSHTRSKRRVLGFFATICSMLLIGIAYLLWSNNQFSDQRDANEYIAVLSKTTRARWLANPPGAAPARLRSGRSLQLMEGLAEVTLSSGAVVVVRGPADLQLVSPMRVKANRGTVRARVGEEATGFVIETPNADVVDLGTEFGVNVSEAGTTDVVVFEGAVDLAYHATDRSTNEIKGSSPTQAATKASHRKRLSSGEALHVNTEGTLQRIVSIDSKLYPTSAVIGSLAQPRPAIITRVSDNIRDPENAQYYQVVHEGLWEDSRAFVDRHHEWNGVDEQGIPHFLLGADYVMTFNSDKWQSDLAINVELSRPATLYVFYDNRRTVPDWLSRGFKDTGIDIGVDEGFPDNPRLPELNAIGPGKSVNVRHSIWKLVVDRPGVVTLGSLATQEIAVNMYGIAAVPLPDVELKRAEFPREDSSFRIPAQDNDTPNTFPEPIAHSDELSNAKSGLNLIKESFAYPGGGVL